MATNARKEFPVFDCDAHINDPAPIWDEYLRRDGAQPGASRPGMTTVSATAGSCSRSG